MAATAWSVYNNSKLLLGLAGFNLDTDTFKCALYASTTNGADNTLSDANARYAVITNEITTGRADYTAGGTTIGNTTWVNVAGTVTWDGPTDPSWTASGGSIVCRVAIIYDDTSANKYGVCWSTLDSSDITVTDGNTLTIQLNAAGIFTLA